MSLSDRDMRRKFEAWISKPPYEKSIRRYPDEPGKYSWPGQYRYYYTQLAWEAFEYATKSACAAERDKVSELLSALQFLRASPNSPSAQECADKMIAELQEWLK